MGKLKKHEDVYFGAPYSREDAIRNCETQEEAYSMIERCICDGGTRYTPDLPAGGGKAAGSLPGRRKRKQI